LVYLGLENSGRPNDLDKGIEAVYGYKENEVGVGSSWWFENISRGQYQNIIVFFF
jgi:hypothetical protein